MGDMFIRKVELYRISIWLLTTICITPHSRHLRLSTFYHVIHLSPYLDSWSWNNLKAADERRRRFFCRRWTIATMYRTGKRRSLNVTLYFCVKQITLNLIFTLFCKQNKNISSQSSLCVLYFLVDLTNWLLCTLCSMWSGRTNGLVCTNNISDMDMSRIWNEMEWSGIEETLIPFILSIFFLFAEIH